MPMPAISKVSFCEILFNYILKGTMFPENKKSRIVHTAWQSCKNTRLRRTAKKHLAPKGKVAALESEANYFMCIV